MTPRQLEDLLFPCPACGAYSTTSFGERDWALRARDKRSDRMHEISELIERAEAGVVGGLLRRLRSIGRRDEDEAEDEPDDELSEWDKPATVTGERIAAPDDEPLPCDACGENLAITWAALAAAHDALSAIDRRWLERYTDAKELLRCALFRSDVRFVTPLGAFATKRWSGLEGYGGIRIADGAAPLFVPAAKFAKLAGAIDPATMLSQMAGDQRCRPEEGDEDVPLPILYEAPALEVTLDLDLPIDTLASELRANRVTPLRGLGRLRLLAVDWESVSGTLLFFDFDEDLRLAISEGWDAGRFY